MKLIQPILTLILFLIVSAPAYAAIDTVQFTIEDSEGNPIEGVRVELYDSNNAYVTDAETNAQGVGEFYLISGGNFTLSARPSSSFSCSSCGIYEDKDFNITLPGGDLTTYDAGDFALPGADCTVTVTVQTTDQTPIDEVYVSAFENAFSGDPQYGGGQTGSNGTVSFAIQSSTNTWGISYYDPDGDFPGDSEDGLTFTCPGTNQVTLTAVEPNTNITLSLVQDNQVVTLETGQYGSLQCFQTDGGTGFFSANIDGPGQAQGTVKAVVPEGGATYECSGWLDGVGIKVATPTLTPGQDVNITLEVLNRDGTVQVSFIDASTKETLSFSDLGSQVDVYGWAFEADDNGNPTFQDHNYTTASSGTVAELSVAIGFPYHIGYWFQTGLGGGTGADELTTASLLTADNGSQYIQDFEDHVITIPEGESTGSLVIELRKADAQVNIVLNGADGNPSAGWCMIQEVVGNSNSNPNSEDGLSDSYGFVSGDDTSDGVASIPAVGGASYLAYCYPYDAFGFGESETVLPPAPQKFQLKSGKTVDLTMNSLIADHQLTMRASKTSTNNNSGDLIGGFCFAFSPDGGESWGELTTGDSTSYNGTIALVSSATYDIGCSLYDETNFYYGVATYTANGESGEVSIEAVDAGKFYEEQTFTGPVNAQIVATIPEEDGTCVNKFTFQAGSIGTTGNGTVKVVSATDFSTGGNTPSKVFAITATDAEGNNKTDFSDKPFTGVICLADDLDTSQAICSSQDSDQGNSWQHNGVLGTDDLGNNICTYNGTHLSNYGVFRTGSGDGTSVGTPRKLKAKNLSGGARSAGPVTMKLNWKAPRELDSPKTTSYDVEIYRGKKLFKTKTTKAGKATTKQRVNCSSKKNRKNWKFRARVSGGLTEQNDYSRFKRFRPCSK